MSEIKKNKIITGMSLENNDHVPGESFAFKRETLCGDKSVGFVKASLTVLNKQSNEFWQMLFKNGKNKPDYMTILLPLNFWTRFLFETMHVMTAQFYVIIEGGCAVFGHWLADFGKCLIDEDHPGQSCLFLTNIRKNVFNTRTGELEFKICFKPWPHKLMTGVYNGNVFYQTKEGDEFARYNNEGTCMKKMGYDRIKTILKSTLCANGYDLIMEKEYSIEREGILLVYLPWSLNEDFKDKPNLFMMRSKFGRLGITCTVMPYPDRAIMISSSAKEKINLGNRFLQIVPSISEQFYFDAEEILTRMIGQSDIKYEINNKQRKNKVEKLLNGEENDNTIILKCSFIN